MTQKKSSTFTPIDDWLFALLEEEVSDKTPGGIVLPGGAGSNDCPVPAIVVSVGKKCDQVKAGDRILVKQSVTYKLSWEGVDYAHLRQSNIVVNLGTPGPATGAPILN